MPTTPPSPDAIRSGNRRELARAITLVESTRPDHREKAEILLAELMPDTGNSIRIGISGVPGVGKSTFIEAFGLHLIKRGHHVCVLAVDPSSPRTGGSILGDKTRMDQLARHPNAFIRPSPSGGTLGGVARRTRESILVCEAAGFDVVLVETVGVGQSEMAVADLVDMFLLLIAPGGGDELQGIKKGIVELADLIVVNKADGDLLAAAERARRDYGAALQLLRGGDGIWTPKVSLCSAQTHEGIDEIWKDVETFKVQMIESGRFEQHRMEQASAWMWNEVLETLSEQFKTHPSIADLAPALEKAVRDGALTPTRAAHKLLSAFID